MMTIESAEADQTLEAAEAFPRHEIEGPELTLRAVYYPHGFPVEVRTNSSEVLRQYESMWGAFAPAYDTPPVRTEVQLVEASDSDSRQSPTRECPPLPRYRMHIPMLVCTADIDNYAIVDLERISVRIVLTQAALDHPLYTQYFLLGMALACISTRYTTPIHAGCVALGGVGILLCGDSGAGKSTLSYACARAGWTYVSDDASFLIGDGRDRRITGNCHQVRFRPTAAELFPELVGMETTPRAAGKPSIELSTLNLNINRAQSVRIEHVVFLNRGPDSMPMIVPASKEMARKSMRQTLFGTRETRSVQHAAIEQLLKAKLYELRYSNLDLTIDRLRVLIESGS